MNLSYPDEFFDLILSNDVLEHIPDPERAFRECFRVLKSGGTVLATFPFHERNDATVTRARLVGHNVEHLLAPRYHGNPVSSDGSLVFNDFGWDLLDVMKGAGFSAAVCEKYSSDEFGHLGNGLLVFRLSKSLSPLSAGLALCLTAHHAAQASSTMPAGSVLRAVVPDSQGLRSAP